ncbi:MAG: low molecular weight phosphotyrosine protein phosphatase [Gammaproteobacteria bacterium]|nr:MAG: low molecular weight phosphotyrosine protein phosphatase [Gammaproteobacteria bacterium]
MGKVKVCFVCMGNICRSPTAHGVFRKLVMDKGYDDKIEIDSAGTHAYHVGEPPDSRAQATARQRGINLSDLRARRVRVADYSKYDYLLAMDQYNYDLLVSQCPDEYLERIRLFMTFSPELGFVEVPDPYYGGDSGFDRVFDMVEAGSRGLLDHIIKSHGL